MTFCHEIEHRLEVLHPWPLLADYQLALAERDRLGLSDARPIYQRLRGEASAAPAKAPPRGASAESAPAPPGA
jgi:hypothetical protein